MYTYGISQRPNITPAANSVEATVSDLLRSRANRFIECLVSATIQISVANATTVLNGGWVAALFADMGILEGGKALSSGDPRLFAFASEYYRGGPGTATHLTTPNIGTYNLKQLVLIPFELVLHGLNPRETQYLELDPLQTLQAYFTLAASNGVARILTVGGATVAITAVKVQVQQFYDDAEGELPHYRPAWRQFSQKIVGADAALEVPFGVTDYVRGITILQDSDTGRRADLINRIAFRGDKGFIWEMVDWDSFARSREHFSGGNVYAEPTGSMVHINFQEAGRLKNCLSPLQDNNFRFVLDVNNNGANPKVVCLLHLLEREPKGKAARRVTVPDDQLPAIGI